MFAVAMVVLTSAAPVLVLNGLDPIELGLGRETPGKSNLVHADDRWSYQFSSAANLAKFKSDPERYGLQIGGACGNMGPLSGRGAPHRWTVFQGRIWIFASEQCRQSFLKHPENFLDKSDAALLRSPDKEKVGQTILDTILKAHGSDVIGRMKSIRQRITTLYKDGDKQSPWVDVTGWTSPNKFESLYEWREKPFGGSTVAGAKKETDESGNKFELAQSEADYLKRNAVRSLPILLKLAAKGIVQSYGAAPKSNLLPECELLVVYLEGGRTELFFNQKSQRVEAIKFRGRSGGPYRQVMHRFSEWKTVHGLVLPTMRQIIIDDVPGARVALEWQIGF